MPFPYTANRLQAWAYDPVIAGLGTATPAAGVLQLCRIDIGPDQAVFATNICVVVSTAGTGATALANCFVGLYDSAGNFIANSGSADQSTPWATAGAKVIAMTATQLLQTNKSYYVGMVIGTQSTTNVAFSAAGSAGANNVGLVNSTARNGTILTGQTSLPASFTPGSVTLAKTPWAGLS
jgi:hypothetical protein